MPPIYIDGEPEYKIGENKGHHVCNEEVQNCLLALIVVKTCG